MNIKALIVSTNKQDIIVLSQLPNLELRREIEVTIETATGTAEAYRKIRTVQPDVLIVNEPMFSGLINVMSKDSHVIILTDVRGKRGSGQIIYVYRPIQMAFVCKKISKLFQNASEESLLHRRDERADFLSKFPEEYPDMDEPRFHHPEMTLEDERSYNLNILKSSGFRFSTKKQKYEANENLVFVSPKTEAIMRAADAPSSAGQLEEPPKANNKTLLGVMVRERPSVIQCVLGAGIVKCVGGAMELQYDDGTQEQIPLDDSRVKLSGDFSKVGQTPVFVDFEGYRAAFIATVMEPVAEIGKVLRFPDKRTYKPGEFFDGTGLVVEIAFNDGKTIQQSNFGLSGYAVEPDDKSVRMEYEGITFEIPIMIEKPRELIEISLSHMPAKTEYHVGDTAFDITGGEVLLVFSDGSHEVIPLTRDMVKKFDSSEAGMNSITIEYQGKQTVIEISVLANRLQCIEVVTPPDKTEYIEGEFFDRSGMDVSAVYENGNREDVKEYDVFPKRPLREGDTEVEVRLMDQTTKTKVTVRKATVTRPEPNVVSIQRHTKMFYPSTEGLRF